MEDIYRHLPWYIKYADLIWFTSAVIAVLMLIALVLFITKLPRIIKNQEDHNALLKRISEKLDKEVDRPN